MEVESRSFQQKVFKTTTSATSNVPSMFVLAENNARARSSSTLTTVNYPRASPPADAFPLHAHRSKMHRSQYNSEDDSSSSSSDSGSSSSSSSDGSSSDDYSDSDGCEDEQDEFPVRQNGKQTAMEMERAARLLLSVSPALVARPRSMSVSHLEPLESLAGLGKLLSGSSFFFLVWPLHHTLLCLIRRVLTHVPQPLWTMGIQCRETAMVPVRSTNCMPVCRV